MQNDWDVRVGRRRFFGFAVLAAAAAGFGCSGQTEPTEVTAPPVTKGNRSILAKHKPEDVKPSKSKPEGK